MFDIIIRNGKKESYIKLNGNKLEGFNALNGDVSPLTEEEVNTINLLKLSDDKSYLGQQDDYDIYLDNISKLKHYFKDDKEDFEVTWVHNGEDGLIYKGDKLGKIKTEVKKISLKSKIVLISSVSFLIISDPNFVLNAQAEDINKSNDISYEAEAINSNYQERASVTVEQIEKYIEENNKLTEEEKEIYYNKKLLTDIIPYYENTNMNILIPLRFDDLQTEYYYEEPDENGYLTSAYYDELIPNRIFVNTYCYEDSLYDKEEEFYDRKAHEDTHRLQASYEYRYIIESSAELISYEYNNKCFIASYLNAVKNLKILMEMVGPEPIWKINFSADDTDLVNIIRANLNEEQANELIGLLKEEPGKNQKEGLDEDITALVSQMYTNIYGEDMRTNPFIDCLLGNGEMNNRYYFNSDLIEKEIPYTNQKNFNFWHTYAVSNTVNPNVLEDIQSPNSEELYILFKNDIEVDNISDFTSSFLEENEVKFYYHGKEIGFESIDLEKYINTPITYQGDVFLEEKEIKYYPIIYESFPEQRINQEEFLNSK